MRFKKLMALVVTIILLVTTLMPLCVVEAAHTEPYTAEEIDMLLLEKSNTYQKYLAEIGDKPYAKESVVVKADSFIASSEDADINKLDSYEGKTNVIEWKIPDNQSVESEEARYTAGNVTYSIEVNESAYYSVKFSYYPLKGSGNKINIGLQIDDGFPYTDLTSFSLDRIYRSKDGIKQDTAGNDYNTTQEEIFDWNEKFAVSDSGVSDDPFLIYLTKGTHTFILYSFNEPFVLSEITFCSPEKPISYEEYIAKYGKVNTPKKEWSTHIQAEDTYKKSEQNMVASTDRTSTKNESTRKESFQFAKTRLNVIGGTTWSYAGQWLEWQVEVPEDGYYEIYFRFKQSYKSGLPSHRRILIDGKVPFEEANLMAFGYSSGWQGKSLSNEKGEALYVYLTAGEKHTLRLENVVGSLSDSIARVNSIVVELNNIYRQCLMITGTDPDMYRDYYLDQEIPNLIPTLKECSKALEEEYKKIKDIIGSERDVSDIINVLNYNIQDMINYPSTIPSRLDTFSGNIGSLSSWALELKEQPLLLDYIGVCTPGAEKEDVNDSFFEAIWREIKAFFYSFITDYSNFEDDGTYHDVITVWVNSGRDQANVINAMINDLFTPQYNIGVDLKITNASVIQAYLSGRAPDISLMIGRGQPVNLALRGALYDISKIEGFDYHGKQISGFDDITGRFSKSAFVPYTLNGAVYAVPDTQNFYMMFYRKDIFKELELTVPKTWDDFWKVMKVIQSNNMEVGLPYTAVDASGSVDNGMGSRNIFSALLLQNGGRFYNDDLSATDLGTPEALEAFQVWTDIYTKMDSQVTYDFYNRFRAGNMPLGLAMYTEYNRLSAAAPEIAGLWEMVPIPGTYKEDGTLSMAQGGSGSASVMLRAAADNGNIKPAWTFLQWWCSAEAQTRYALDVEAVLGVVGRVATANLEAFENLSWNGKEREYLKIARNHLEEIPEAPGGYYLTRDLDNAFRDVVYNERNARESLLSWKLSVDAEIQRKREEFGLE